MQAKKNKKASKPNVKKRNELVFGSVKDFSYALELTHDKTEVWIEILTPWGARVQKRIVLPYKKDATMQAKKKKKEKASKQTLKTIDSVKKDDTIVPQTPPPLSNDDPCHILQIPEEIMVRQEENKRLYL